MKGIKHEGDMIKRGNGGFTLVEILVSLAIFAFGALAIAQLQAVTARGNSEARRLGEASRIAREMIEEMGMLRSFYKPVNDICHGDTFKLANTPGTEIVNALVDPESKGVAVDVLCPTTAEAAGITDDRGALESLMGTDISDANLAKAADHCLKQSESSECESVDTYLNFTGDRTAMYWVVWSLWAGHPGLTQVDVHIDPIERPLNTSVILFVYWRGIDRDENGNQRRHWVKISSVLTAKDLTYYY